MKNEKRNIYPSEKHFAMVPETLLASIANKDSPLTEVSLSVYCATDRFFDKRFSPPVAFPKLETLEVRTSLSRGTVSKHLSLLNDAGFLVREYACRIQGRGVLDSIGTIKPVSQYKKACQKAAVFKKKTMTGATVALIFYQPKDGEPKKADLVAKGYLPDDSTHDEFPQYSDEDQDTSPRTSTPPRQKRGSPVDEREQNDNNRSTTTKSDNQENDTSGITFSNKPKKGPWCKYISNGRIASLVKFEIDEDINFQKTVMCLKFLGQQGSIQKFESLRLKDRLWFLELPTVESVNYVLFKLAYLRYRPTDDLENGVNLVREKYEGTDCIDDITRYDFVEHLRSYPEDSLVDTNEVH